jgi:excisionase family DNA binding protein
MAMADKAPLETAAQYEEPFPVEGSLAERVRTEIHQILRSLEAAHSTLDIHFLAFLRATSRFGFFTFGPVTIDVRLIEDIVERTTQRRLASAQRQTAGLTDDSERFFAKLAHEVQRTGGTHRVDELHYLLAFMRTKEGIPGRVFGELGVTPEQVENYARTRAQTAAPPAEEKLYSPEEAAEYLGVHVKTIRSWIRQGRLRASRLTGQRALRIRASDLAHVLEPVSPEDA